MLGERLGERYERVSTDLPMLPPPDPHETPRPPPDLELASPWAVFLNGPPTENEDEFSEAVLRYRPGLLFVAAP